MISNEQLHAVIKQAIDEEAKKIVDEALAKVESDMRKAGMRVASAIADSIKIHQQKNSMLDGGVEFVIRVTI